VAESAWRRPDFAGFMGEKTDAPGGVTREAFHVYL